MAEAEPDEAWASWCPLHAEPKPDCPFCRRALEPASADDVNTPLTLALDPHELAEARQQAWRDRDAEAARELTRALNGHSRDIDRHARKSKYEDDAGGEWGSKRRRCWDRAGGRHPYTPKRTIDSLMRSNGVRRRSKRSDVFRPDGSLRRGWMIKKAGTTGNPIGRPPRRRSYNTAIVDVFEQELKRLFAGKAYEMLPAPRHLRAAVVEAAKRLDVSAEWVRRDPEVRELIDDYDAWRKEIVVLLDSYRAPQKLTAKSLGITDRAVRSYLKAERICTNPPSSSGAIEPRSASDRGFTMTHGAELLDELEAVRTRARDLVVGTVPLIERLTTVFEGEFARTAPAAIEALERLANGVVDDEKVA